MKIRNTQYLPAIIMLLMLALSGCFGNDYQKDFEALAEKAKEDGGSASQTCPMGKWASPTCTGGTKSLTFYFDSNGTGYTSNPECTGQCTPLIFRFNYTVSGSTITYTFTSADAVVCNGSSSTPALPTNRGPYSITYTCGSNGNQLTTQTTGSQSSATFTRVQ